MPCGFVRAGAEKPDGCVPKAVFVPEAEQIRNSTPLHLATFTRRVEQADFSPTRCNEFGASVIWKQDCWNRRRRMIPTFCGDPCRIGRSRFCGRNGRAPGNDPGRIAGSGRRQNPPQRGPNPWFRPISQASVRLWHSGDVSSLKYRSTMRRRKARDSAISSMPFIPSSMLIQPE